MGNVKKNDPSLVEPSPAQHNEPA